MDIKAGDLEAIEDEATFVRFFVDYAEDVFHPNATIPSVVRTEGY